MNIRNLFFFCFLLYCYSFCSTTHAADVSTAKLKAFYNSLDPLSVSQHLAFYELYPYSPEGKQALKEAYRLLAGKPATDRSTLEIPSSLTLSINALVGLVNKHSSESTLELADNELASINAIASRLSNRKLKGFGATSEEEVLQLPSQEIDLARAVLLSQLGEGTPSMRRIKSYEAAIDLMALQILSRLRPQALPKDKIRAINRFIFEEMGFRFPPHSTYAKDIDLYTFLPSVLDSRRGVCLGVSILYICLAQRLNLDLEIVTPPGHIFVRWHQGNESINIETTARGIDLPDDQYLGVDTRKLQQRNIKETIGLAHFNQASVFLEREEYEKALMSYRKAEKYLIDDKHLMSLMGCTALLHGDESLGRKLMEQVVDYLPDHAVSKDTIAEDYLNGNTAVDGIEAVFMQVDETRESIIKKKDALEAALVKYPRFREGIFALASTWLQLHRTGEALKTLQRYHSIDPRNATVEYYLSALHAERLDYNRSWDHLHIAERLVEERQHHPETLFELRQALAERCPE